MGVIGQAPARPVAGRTKPRQTAAKGKGKGPAQPVASAKPDAGPSRPRQGKVKGKAGQPNPKDHGHLKGDKGEHLVAVSDSELALTKAFAA
jgi:hypothetical protein